MSIESQQHLDQQNQRAIKRIEEALATLADHWPSYNEPVYEHGFELTEMHLKKILEQLKQG